MGRKRVVMDATHRQDRVGVVVVVLVLRHVAVVALPRRRASSSMRHGSCEFYEWRIVCVCCLQAPKGLLSRSLSLSLTLSRALAHERHQLDACPAVPAPDSSNFRALNLTSDQNFFLKTSFHPKVLDSYRRFLCMHLYIATFENSGDV